LPNLFANSQPRMSLANACNAVMLQTSSNGGYVTLATMSDPNQALSEQFCVARTYAMAQGEDLMGQITGLTRPRSPSNARPSPACCRVRSTACP
jgi:hypothetical protein